MAIKTLEDAKREISQRYIGRCGIHGVDIRRTVNAICVYHDKSLPGNSLAEMKELVAPYGLITVKNNPPAFASKLRSKFGRMRRSQPV